MSESPLEPGKIDAYLATPTAIERELRRLFFNWERLTIFDIGACEGEESIRYVRRFPRARLFAFEPLPDNQRLIRINFERYQVRTAELVPIAFSDRQGLADFHVSSGRPDELFAGKEWNYGNKSSSLLAPVQTNQPMYGWLLFEKKIQVPTETVDHFVLHRKIARVDFVHMDVQGAEHLVLAGAAQTLKHVTAIWTEVAEKELYRSQVLRPGIEAFMRTAGFRKVMYLPNGPEGDQLYINLRKPRAVAYLAAKTAWSLLRSVCHSARRSFFATAKYS